MFKYPTHCKTVAIEEIDDACISPAKQKNTEKQCIHL